MIFKRIIKYVSITLLLIISLILIAWGAIIGLILTPEMLTPQVENILQKYTRSEVSIARVDLSLFTRFPNVTLRIDSLQITQTRDSIDDLIFARQCRISVDPKAFFEDKSIVVNRLSLIGTSIYVYVDSLNGPVKTFILPETIEEVGEVAVEEASSIDLSEYKFSLKRMKIDSMQITIDDRTRQFYTRVDNFGADVSMNISSSLSNLDVVTGFSNLIVWHEGDLLVKKTSMDLRSQMVFDRDSMQLSFERARVKVNDIDLKMRGLLCQDTTANGLYIDLRSSLNTPSLSEFLALIPSSVIDTKDEITTEGEVVFDVEVKGVYSDESMPIIDATLKVTDAMARYSSRKVALEEVDCDAFAHIDLNEPINSYADVKSLHVNTSDIIDLNMSGMLTNIFEDPNIDVTIGAEFDFDRFIEVFPLNDGVTCSGTSVNNIVTQFKMSDIESSNYADLYIEGESTFYNLDISIDASKLNNDSMSMAYLSMQADKGTLLFGDRAQRGNTNNRSLRSQANFMGLNYMAKSGEYISIRDIELSLGVNLDRTTAEINGFRIQGVAQDMNVGVDTLFNANLESSEVSLLVRPKRGSDERTITLEIGSQQITATEPNFNSELELSTVDLNIYLEQLSDEQLKQLKEEQTQGQGQGQPRTNQQSPQQDEQQRPQWSMTGTMSFSDFGMFSDAFPIDVAIAESSISMDNKTIYLDNAVVSLGGSQIVATGYIQNMIRKMFIDPRASVSGELAIKSPLINFDELIEASNQSILMQEEEDTETEEVVVAATEISEPLTDSLGRPIRTDEGAMLLVPKMIDFIFDLNVDKAIFWDAEIERVEGRATVNNGVLSLDHMTLSAIGAEAVGSVVYRNIDRRRSNIAANMSLIGVDVNRIGELLPSVNSMFPMLESFEGVIDFDIKANTNIDSALQVDFTTLYSTMRFKGKDMVLMDSESFEDLASTLMFKNKDRNLIDSVEVFALVAESVIDVLPFSMSIDRYTAIIGGSQVIDPESFDINYDYNISIIKSPLPFKAGVDVSGDLEDFKFKITKAKLKNTDFDEQRRIYTEYSSSIDASEAALEQELEAKRLEMQAKRREQRQAQAAIEAETEAQIEKEEAEEAEE